jgi:hypothetical protein
VEAILLQLLGKHGLAALDPLLKNEDLAAFVTPRAVIGWLQKAPYGDLALPRFDSLNKSGYGYCGKVSIQDESYEFDKVTEEQVAAMVSVSLEQKVSADIKALDLAKLSKTIDLLLKTQQRYEPKEPEAPAAPKQEPLQPEPQEKAPIARVRRRGLNKTLLVSNKESKTLCKMCNKPQFEKGEFKGCTCLKGLAKSIDCVEKNSNYLLIFDSDCGVDEMLTIAEAIGRI